jgi:hypothetical protein
VPDLQVVNFLLRVFDDFGRAAAGAVETEPASVYVERVDGALSRLIPPPPPLRPKALLKHKKKGGNS